MLMGGAGLLLVLAVAFGVRWWTVGRFMVGTDNAYIRADILTVAPRVSGNLVAVEVRDNQMVRAGDVIARIDDRDYRARVDAAEGALAAAQADVSARQAGIASLDARSRQQQGNIAQCDATLAARQADSRLAALEYKRQTALFGQQVSSRQSLETAQASASKAAAGVAEAHATLDTARGMLPVLKSEREAGMADLRKAEATVRQARAALDAARLDLDRTVIRAPSAGLVGQRVLRVGQYVEAGAPLLAIVPSDAYVVANFKETQTNHIRPGQPVGIGVDAFGGEVLKGRVDSFAPASGAQFALLPPDNATGNFTKIIQRMPVRIRLEPGQTRLGDLRPGMSVEVAVDTRGDRR